MNLHIDNRRLTVEKRTLFVKVQKKQLFHKMEDIVPTIFSQDEFLLDSRPALTEILHGVESPHAVLQPQTGRMATAEADWRDDSKSLDDRFKAGFKAAVLALVDEDGNALLTEEDEEAIRAASFDPIYRIFSIGLGFWSQSENEKTDSEKTAASSDRQATNGSDDDPSAREREPGSSGRPPGAKKNSETTPN